jgi:outer membrane protein assembly factor BamA
VDGGNVWLQEHDNNYPNGNFSFSGNSTVGSFINQIAIGAGVGLRFDFNFFIIRLDGALKIKDPSRSPGERWINNDKGASFQWLRDGVLNFGIGYPF